jgi:hypothetical protein
MGKCHLVKKHQPQSHAAINSQIYQKIAILSCDCGLGESKHFLI